jgi:hypothetical protein
MFQFPGFASPAYEFSRWCFQLYRPASPLVRTSLRGLTAPFDVLIGERGRGLFRVSPPPASALVLANLAPAVLPRAAALLHPFECHCHPSLGFRRPARFDRKSAAAPSVYSTYSARPLSWGSAPSSGHQRKGSGVDPGIPTSPAVASSGFEPSRRLDPLRAFPGISTRGRSWDCYLQGFSPPADPDPLSRLRTLLALPDPTLER